MCRGQEHSNQDGPNAHDGEASRRPSESFPWHLGAMDAHCHPTDTMRSVSSIPTMRARALTVMATRAQDQDLVDKVACDMRLQDDRASLTQGDASCVVIPAFGWHPWFSHQIYDDTGANPAYKGDDVDAKESHYTSVLVPVPEDPGFIAALPSPTPLSELISSTRALVSAHPHALVGEIGLDKAFRLPHQWESGPDRDDTLTPGGREGRALSPYRVRIQHQQAVLEAQLRLAGELERPVSVHGVQVHGVLRDTIAACWKGYERQVVSRRKQRMVAPGAEDSDSDDESSDRPKPFPPRICLHSFSGSAQVLRQWLHPSTPADIYFSFSEAVNMGTDAGLARTREVVLDVPADRILVESDLHIAGDAMDAALESMYRFVCEVKGWDLEEGVQRIRGNFDRFIFG